jgi:hypothetical protein
MEERAHTESFLSIRTKGGPGLRVAVTSGSNAKNAAQMVDEHLMMIVIG